MSAMTFATVREFSHRKHHVATRAVLIILFWAVAALLVMVAHRSLEGVSPLISTGVKLGAIVAIAYVYIEFTAGGATIDQAVLVGLAWLVLAMVTEVAAASSSGQGWYELLGSPARPGFRHLLLFSWLMAPALFARSRS